MMLAPTVLDTTTDTTTELLRDTLRPLAIGLELFTGDYTGVDGLLFEPDGEDFDFDNPVDPQLNAQGRAHVASMAAAARQGQQRRRDHLETLDDPTGDIFDVLASLDEMALLLWTALHGTDDCPATSKYALQRAGVSAGEAFTDLMGENYA
jgi:hypothetical protein